MGRATRAGLCAFGGGIRGAGPVDRLTTQNGLDPLPCTGQTPLAQPGQRLAALPQPQRVVQAQPADLECLDHLDELVACLLVAHRSGDVAR